MRNVPAPKKHFAKIHQWAHRFVLLLRVLWLEFSTFFYWVIITVSLSTTCIFAFYPRADLPHQSLTLLQSFYYTWLMMFFETPLPYVEDWRIAPLFFLLPLLGLIVIAEGVVHLGNLLVHRKRYSREWQKMLAATYENHVIVCGLGNVGVRVVQHLKQFDETCIVIERDDGARFIHEVSSSEIPVLIGDARDPKVLENANVRSAKAIIAVTDNDLANLETALTAREYNASIKVVIRMFDQKLAKKVERFLGIHGAYSSSARSARLFAQAAISENILDSFEFGGTVINAYQLTIEPNSPLVGETIDDVRYKHEVTVLMHEHSSGELDWNPSPSNSLHVNDKLLIMTDREGIKRLQTGMKKKLALPKNEID
ncbi:MAG TPA: TrkA family potassium uptake protein [Candidatus Obscuribacterales bacterium]